VNLARGELTIRADKAKDGDMRVLPISARLAAVLKMAQTDPSGKNYQPDAYVFGAVGLQLGSIKRAWETCVLKAHGYEPAWSKGTLVPASRAALATIDLHFHDLRHEGASRLLEAGWPIHHAGHARAQQPRTNEYVPECDRRRAARQHAPER
jgi:integrase